MKTDLPAAATPEIAFFREIAASLALITRKDHVLLSRSVDGSGGVHQFVDSVAFWSNQRFIDNVRYALDKTPCQQVLAGNAAVYPERVQQLFPEDRDLQELGAQSYLGCPIRSLALDVVGHIAVIDSRPMTNAAELMTIARAFASLAACEFDRLRMIERVRQSERRYRILYDSTPAILFTVAQDHTVASLNAYGFARLGYVPQEIVGRPLLDIVLPEDARTCRRHIDACFADDGRVHCWELRKRHRDGSVARYRESARVIDDAAGSRSLLVVSEDVTEAHARSELLSFHASHDSLTGLLNRRQFESHLEALLCSDRPAHMRHALCYLDLDRFKIVNDRCGHLAGDELLRRLSHLLHSGIRKTDLLARLGGDEFALLMEDCAPERAQQIAEELVRLVQDHRFDWNSERFSIGVSVGVVSIDSETRSIAAVLEAADAACYTAKNAGRNRVHVASGRSADAAAAAVPPRPGPAAADR